MGLVKYAQTTTEDTTRIAVYMENTTLSSIEPFEEGSSFILIPLGVLLGIIILALLVYLMASNRRRLVHLYCKKRQSRRFLYEEDNEYDSPLEQNPEAVEEEEDGVDNEDNPTKSLLRGKLQINNRYENYLSTSQLNRSSDLFT